MTDVPEPIPFATNKFEFLNSSILHYLNILNNLHVQKSQLLEQVKLVNKQMEQCKNEMSFTKEILRDYRGVLKK